MKNSNPRTAVFTAVTSITLLWILFFAAQSFLVRPLNPNVGYLPEKTTAELRIDGKKLISEGFTALFLSDESETQALLEKLLNQSKKQNKSLQLGINFLSDVYLFEEEFQNREVSGVLLNLRDPKLFKKNIHTHLNKNQVFSSNDEVAVILSFKEKENINAADLQVHADMILQQTKVNRKHFAESQNLLDFSFSKPQRSELSAFESGSFSINIKIDTVLSKGEIELDESIKPLLRHQLKPKGFHATITTLSEPLRDSLEGIYELFNIGNRIDGISMNYYSLEIKEVPRLYLIPKLDALFHFEAEISKKSFIDSLQNSDVFDTIAPTKIVYGEQNYYYEVIDANTVFIGVNKPNNNILSSEDLLFHFQGDPAKLTTLEGTGMMRKLVEIISFFAASKNLFEAIESVDLRIMGRGANNLDGTIVCKDEQSALRLITQFLFDANLIR